MSTQQETHVNNVNNGQVIRLVDMVKALKFNMVIELTTNEKVAFIISDDKYLEMFEDAIVKEWRIDPSSMMLVINIIE